MTSIFKTDCVNKYFTPWFWMIFAIGRTTHWVPGTFSLPVKLYMHSSIQLFVWPDKKCYSLTCIYAIKVLNATMWWNLFKTELILSLNSIPYSTNLHNWFPKSLNTIQWKQRPIRLNKKTFLNVTVWFFDLRFYSGG